MASVTCHQLSEGLHLTPLSAEAAVTASCQADARVWIDLQDCADDELGPWLDRLGVTGLARRLCLEAGDHPGFYPLKHELFFAIPTLVEAEGHPTLGQVAVVIRENLLLTLHRGPLAGRRQLEGLQFAEAWLAERSVAAMVAAMLINQSLRCLHHIAEVKRSALALGDRAQADPDSIRLDEVLDLRARLFRLGPVASDQLPVLEALHATDRSVFQQQQVHEYLHCAMVNLAAVQGALARLDKKLGDLLADMQMRAQERTNHRLAVLTVISAIFLPLTLMAGIWGMNFEHIPGLKLPFGYLMALASMGLVGTVMFLWFRKGGWFD